MVDRQGIDAKIHRARECLERLQSDIVAHCEYHTQRRVLEMVSRARDPMLRRFQVRESDPGYVPMDVPIRVGEIAYNLRSALDHLVYALVRDNNGTPARRHEFPIVEEERRYRKAASHRLGGIAQDRLDLIEAFQPFRGGIGHHLLMLHRICNIDKHRHLNVVNTQTSLNARLKEGAESSWLPSQARGGIALYFDVQGTEHENGVEPRVTVDVCFRDPEIVDLSPNYGTASEVEFPRWPPVIPVLSSCLNAVAIVTEYLTAAELLPPSVLSYE